MDASKSWYIVYTFSGQEKKVTDILSRKKFESYCPLNNIAQPGHWKRISYEALFNSYCFVRISESQIPVLKQTNGVISFVYWLNKPVVVPDQEIDAIKEFLWEYKTVKSVRLEKANVDNETSAPGNLLTASNDHKFYLNNNITKVALPSLGYLMVAEEKILNQQVIVKQLFPRRRSIMQRIVG